MNSITSNFHLAEKNTRFGSSTTQEPGLFGLHKREIGTAEHSLCLLHRVNFTGSRLFAHVKKLDKPVALSMQRCLILHSCHEFTFGVLQLDSAAARAASVLAFTPSF